MARRGLEAQMSADAVVRRRIYPAEINALELMESPQLTQLRLRQLAGGLPHLNCA
jgi:hypothetical protein